MATVEEVTRAKNEAKDYADELIEGLEKDIGQDMEAAKDYTDKAVSELDKNTKRPSPML